MSVPVTIHTRPKPPWLVFVVDRSPTTSTSIPATASATPAWAGHRRDAGAALEEVVAQRGHDTVESAIRAGRHRSAWCCTDSTIRPAHDRRVQPTRLVDNTLPNGTYVSPKFEVRGVEPSAIDGRRRRPAQRDHRDRDVDPPGRHIRDVRSEPTTIGSSATSWNQRRGDVRTAGARSRTRNVRTSSVGHRRNLSGARVANRMCSTGTPTRALRCSTARSEPSGSNMCSG